jgi:hypothetical protein
MADSPSPTPTPPRTERQRILDLEIRRTEVYLARLQKGMSPEAIARAEAAFAAKAERARAAKQMMLMKRTAQYLSPAPQPPAHVPYY